MFAIFCIIDRELHMYIQNRLATGGVGARLLRPFTHYKWKKKIKIIVDWFTRTTKLYLMNRKNLYTKGKDGSWKYEAERRQINEGRFLCGWVDTRVTIATEFYKNWTVSNNSQTIDNFIKFWISKIVHLVLQ